jgi:thioredoxin 1
MIEITKDNYEMEIKKPLVFMYAYGNNCPHCEALKPKVEKIEKEYESKASFVKMNAHENKRTSRSLGIMNLPKLLVFKDGNVIDSFNQMMIDNGIDNKIKELV